jgi:hypothetical protein
VVLFEGIFDPQMASQNPLAGGPDFVIALRNALKKTPGAYSTPPPTGGTQISSRFADDRLAILDGLCEYSGWNRNQIINAFVDRGLFEVFQYVSDEVVEKIMEHAAHRVIPTFDPSAALAKEISSYTRFRIFPTPQRIREGQPPEPVEKVWMTGFIDRERGTINLDEAVISGHRLPLHLRHIESIHPDTVQDAKDGFKNAMLSLNVQVIFRGRDLVLEPFATESQSKRRRS